MISGKEDAGNNYARGYYSLGKHMVDVCLDRIRKLADQCSGLQGFLLYNSMGGGTGSGFSSLLMERISTEYGKKTKIGLSIWPSAQTSTSMNDTYNTIFSNSSQLEFMNVNFSFDNEALYDISQKALGIERPTYTNLNRITAKVISSLTSPLRFESSIMQ